ncbi:ribonuclease H-like domain-containing protein [Candidatus Microgenomates bacterium]|nr:ribonuclease H-like domain-containing protein [Candidatus Microgenomates bacterium]
MKKMFLDIETIPAGEDKHDILRLVHAQKIKDKKKVPETFEEFLEYTNFDGSFGRIACISYALNNEKPKTLFGDEKKMLQDFWKEAKDVDLFVGFNVMDFDLRFIYQRSIIFNVQPSRELPFIKNTKTPIYDVMYEWSKWGVVQKISLDLLAKALGIPSSKDGEVIAKTVWDAFKKGKIQQICEYCQRDVEVTRAIYKRMEFT